MEDPDFRRLFESAPGCYLVLSPAFEILAATDAYLAATTTKREAVIGRRLSEVFPDGTFEERQWTVTNTPIMDPDGSVVYVIHALAAAAPARAAERFGQLLEAAPDAIVVVSREGKIELVNIQAEVLFGYPRVELLGQPLELLIPDAVRSSHAAHLTRYFASPTRRAMGSGMELVGRRKDGSTVPVEVSLSPVRTPEGFSVSAAIRDITERHRMEAEAKLAAERLKSAVESVPDAFALFDATDHLVLCNSTYRALLGDNVSGPVMGLSYESLLDAWTRTLAFASDDERAAFRASRLARRREPSSSFEVGTQDGRKLRVTDRRTPDGGLVKTVWDLTDDARKNEELREARAAADVANAAKSEFLSSMSHELRTPLNAILGFAQLLERDKKEPLSRRHRDRAEQILRGGEHLLRLIDDVLDLSRIEAGGVSISPEPVGVSEVLAEIRTTLGPAAARASVGLVVAPVPDGAHFVLADRTRFSQILMNFGSNAIKYNRSGGAVTFRVSMAQPTAVRVTVCDTGHGIPLDKQDKLFQPFQRAGQEIGPIEGTGIGLTITKRLAELMSGSVGFRSVPGEGSEFWVELPARVVVGETHVLPPTDQARRLGTDRRGTVLYVEDNPANVSFMRDLLDAFEGIELLTATTAEVGIELARARVPEVILMDINLPGMSGLDALQALRGYPETKDIPVIALTAAASERDRERGEKAGFYRYLTKPVKVAELERALETLLGG